MSDSEEEVSEKHFKICLIGDSQVGKTSIASRYATDNFGKFPNTVGVDVFLKRTTLPGPRHITLKVTQNYILYKVYALKRVRSKTRVLRNVCATKRVSFKESALITCAH